jgi:indolepyruvate ferredoxin oxidoreductase
LPPPFQRDDRQRRRACQVRPSTRWRFRFTNFSTSLWDAVDIFGYTEERRTERELIAEYEALKREVLAGLTPQNHAAAVQLASLPEEVRGFGRIKSRSLQAFRQRAFNSMQSFLESPRQVAAE